MNETLSLLHRHRSQRAFSDAPIDDAQLNAIVEAAYRGPTSVNGQQVSLVVVREAGRRARIAEIAGGQPWIAKAPVFIAVVIDFHKTAEGARLAGETQCIQGSVEGLLLGAVDAGIALDRLMVAAQSLGLGIVPIGGIRRDPQAMIELLGLPPQTFPVVGVAIGHVAVEASQKPRLPLASFRHDEHYASDHLAQQIKDYDLELMHYWQDIGRADGAPWSSNTAGIYKQVYFPNVKPVAARQGFVNEA